MIKYDLSILIPSRNEMFLARTVENILENIRGKTEIIIALDGSWAEPAIPVDPRVTIVYFPEALGQRGATNQACRLSKAKYVMKIDAHCAVSEGFDVQLMQDMQDDWTVTPLMRNLHAFDWVCPKCQSRQYQGPSEKYEKCPKCDGIRKKEIMWIAKESPKSTSFRFDKTLHFQYFNEFRHRPEGKGDITPTLSLQGSCFMLTREKYWELDICDEKHGSWGQQGVEVALKTWMSGGTVMCNQKAYYAHMFRTQGGDFGFPYPLSGSDVDKARKYSRWLFKEGNWKPAKLTLEQVLDKFYPVPDWHNAETKPEQQKKGIVFYTDNQVNTKIAHRVQDNLRKTGLPIVSASLKPMPHFGNNIHLPLERGYLTMFKQQLAALEASTAEIIYMCEHDVLYHPSHFDFTPPRNDVFYYNINVWKVDAESGHSLWVDECRQVSGLVAYRELLLGEYRRRIAYVEKNGFSRGNGFEPGTKTIAKGGFSDYTSENFKSAYPNIDIRSTHNLTPNRWKKEQFRNQSNTIGWTESHLSKLPGWNLDRL